ncbi:uncharacterized protein LOC116343936 isoform X2 [Contarinia nasturtii]|uniref:uncharacterized protein LOC116343936 isoform X2 n=1 Tax=Contarinia nasturtii TaxID=265458 RepID=UPI0012D45BB0|nr:uncharacterized protein LOC116343936 isoform X2 [Contarinia nasturtii]
MKALRLKKVIDFVGNYQNSFSFKMVLLVLFSAFLIHYFASQCEGVLTPQGNAPAIAQLISMGANLSAQYNHGMNHIGRPKMVILKLPRSLL